MVNLAALSANMPPPEPISRTCRLVGGGVFVARRQEFMKVWRRGFMRWRRREGPWGSHHDDARAEKWETSVLSIVFTRGEVVETCRGEGALGIGVMAARHGRDIRGLIRRVRRRCRIMGILGDAIARCTERLALIVLVDGLFWRFWGIKIRSLDILIHDEWPSLVVQPCCTKYVG